MVVTGFFAQCHGISVMALFVVYCLVIREVTCEIPKRDMISEI